MRLGQVLPSLCGRGVCAWSRRDHGKLAPGEDEQRARATLRSAPSASCQRRASQAILDGSSSIGDGQMVAGCKAHCTCVHQSTVEMDQPGVGVSTRRLPSFSCAAGGRERETARWARERGRGVRHHEGSRTLFSSSPQLAWSIGWANGRTPNRPFQAKIASSQGCNNGARLIRTSNGTPDSLGGRRTRQGRIP